MSRRPGWLPWLTAGLVVALFSGLGVWQLQRAADKRAVLAALDDTGKPALRRLPEDPGALEAIARRRVRLDGTLEGERQFLLENRILEGQPGVDVLTPLRLADGRRVLVDRGWVAIGPGREPVRSTALAETRGASVQGRLWLPEPGLGLGDAVAAGAGWPRRVTRLDFGALEEELGRPLVPAVIRARGDAPWLYRPRALRPRFGPMRHYGYAFQWFALALAVLVIAGIQVWRRQRRDHR